MARTPLDNPTWASLRGPHARFAERHGQVARYPTAVAPFLAVPDEPDEDVWPDIAALAGPGALVSLAGQEQAPPEGWEIVMDVPGVQLVGEGVKAAEDAEAVRLTSRDVPEMLALVERTKPGPFLPRTIELGTYLG